MKNTLLKKIIAVAFLTGLSICSFPLISQAESECESDNCGNGGNGGLQVQVPEDKVTMELMLSVDVSGSINSDEYRLQKEGYINAFKNQKVKDAIELLPHGLAVAIETWSGNIKKTSQWYKLTTAADAEYFANVVVPSTLNQSKGGGSTNITEALRSASSKLVTNEYNGDILVIDISGDGFDNTARTSSGGRCGLSKGTPVEQVVCAPLRKVRDNAVNNGIIINGLPIVSKYAQSDRQHELATYYKNNVIGGVNPTTGTTTTADGKPVSFIQVAEDFENFAEAVAIKIEKEILTIIEIVPPNPDPNVNRKPYVIDDTAISPNGFSVRVDVLANDSDPDGDDDKLNITQFTRGSNGSVVKRFNSAKSRYELIYTPNRRNFVGIDTFTYEATDEKGATGTATVTVSVGEEPPIPEEKDVQSYPAD